MAGHNTRQAEAYCFGGIKVVFVIFYPEFHMLAMGAGSVLKDMNSMGKSLYVGFIDYDRHSANQLHSCFMGNCPSGG